jgi:PPIC-type PPIASE domain
MRNRWLLVLMFGVLAWGQAKTAPAPAQKSATADDDDKPAPPPPDLAPDAPVLTIKGLCPPTPGKPNEVADKSCVTVITKEQFEKVARAIQPSLSPVVKKQLINLYPRLLIMSREAEARGMDKEDDFHQKLDLARLQILSQELTHHLQEDAAKVPDQEISEYYEKNPDMFREYTMEHIFIPRVKQEPPPVQKLSEQVEKAREKSAEDEMTKLAGVLRARAAAGAPFETLQKEAYQSAGLKGNPPNASMGIIRRAGLPPGHAAAFSLKVGEVSQVISDGGGHYIYKLDAAKMDSQADVKLEIHDLLKSQRLHDLMKKIQGPFTTEANDAYFGATTSASAAAEKKGDEDEGAKSPKE